MLRVIVVAASVWLAGLAGSAHAALQLRDQGTLGSPVSVRPLGDGVRYVAYERTHPGPVEVLDVISRTRRTIPQFARCSLQDIHHGELLWACHEWPTLNGAVQDLASGRIEILPPPTPTLLGSAEPGNWRYTRLGKRFVMSVASGYKIRNTAYLDRHTKTERSVTERRDWVVDLDAPRLTRKLCRGQRRALEYGEISNLVPAPLSTAGQWAATVNYDGRLELQRCGAKIETIARPADAIVRQPVINDRFMAWVEYYPAARAALGRVRVAVRVHRSGRIQRSQFTKRGTYLSLLLFGRRLFAVQDAGGGGSGGL